MVVDDNETRRKELTRSLAEYAYEVVSAETPAEGMRFAIGLTPTVVLAGATIEGFADATVLKNIAPPEGQPGPKLVLLQESEEIAAELPEEVLVLPVAGLTNAAVVRKVRTILLGRELELEPDVRVESLLGDLQLVPLFDLLPRLQKVIFTGRLLVEEGEVFLESGEVIGSRTQTVRGVKAFARIGRIATGACRLLVGPPGIEREIKADLLSVMATAMEDQHRFNDALSALPDWESRLRVEMGPAFFSTHFSPVQQGVLQAGQTSRSIRSLVDAVPFPDGEVLDELVRLRDLGFVAFEEPEVRVRVVTDSTADLPPEVARVNGIHVVPLSVIFGDEIYKDGVDLTPGGFYKMLEQKKEVHPRTSPPSKGEFLAEYRLLAGKRDLVSIHISEKMSQTLVHAREAAEEGSEELQRLRADSSPLTIEIVDSLQVSTGLGLMSLLAARMAQRNLSAAEIRRRLEEMRERFHLLFVVDTLEYLARGGRIGKARALLGGLLGIKPILGLVGGEVVPVDKVRGGKAAHPRVVELFKERVDASQPVIVGLGHAAAPVWADRLRSLLQQSFIVSEILDTEIGPVVGTHAGPGSVGAVMFQPTEEETPLVAPLPSSE